MPHHANGDPAAAGSPDEWGWLSAILDHSPAVVYIKDRDGRHLFVNRRFEELFSLARDRVAGRFNRDLFPAEVADRLTSHDRQVLEHGAPAEYEEVVWRPAGARTFTSLKFPLRDQAGQVIGLCGISMDVTERRVAEEGLRREKEFTERLIASSVDGILAFDTECRYTVWNPGMERIAGMPASTVMGKRAFEIFPFLVETGEDRALREALAGRATITQDRPYTIPESGRAGFYEGHYAPIHDATGRVVGGLAVIRDVTDRKRLEEERIGLAREHAARVAAEASAQRFEFLAQASEALASSLDYAQTLRDLAQLCIPVLGDLCIVDVIEVGGLRRVTTAHADSAKAELLEDLRRRFPPSLDSPQPSAQVLRSGEPELLAEVTPEIVAAHTRDAQHAALIRAIGIRSHLAVPLVARGSTVGVISLGVTESDRRYRPDDLALAQELARRAALAVDNARLYQAAQEELAERRRAEKALRESEARLALAQRAANVGTWDWDFVTGAVAWSEGIYLLLGLRPEDVAPSASAWIESIHPEDRADTLRLSGEAVNGSGDFYAEFRILQPDGAYRWVASKGSVIRSATGTPTRFIGVNFDISQRKHVEEALRESEDRIRKLADNLPSGFIYQVIHTPDDSRSFTYVSGGVETVCGLPPAAIRADSSILYGLIDPEDQPRVAAAEDEALQTRRPFDCQFRIHGSGGVRWLHCRSAPRDLPGGGAIWDGVAADVTDHKAAEEAVARDSRILANVRDSVIVTDVAGIVTYWNEGATRLFGWTAEEMLGQRYVDRFPNPQARDFIAEQMRTRGAEGWTMEWESYRKDGSRVWIDARIVPMTDAAGRPVGLLGVAHNITARKRAEAALKDADRRKDEFMAMLAHELRNPLAPLRNALQILQLRGGDVGIVDKVREMMERQLGHLGRLVDDLLDVARITTGKVQLRKERLDLVRVTLQAAADYKAAFEAKGVRLGVRLPEDPVWVSGDATRLAQVLDNLLTNALKFTARDGEVSVSVAADFGFAARIAVQDTGAGIEPEMLARLFEPFSQADRTLDRSAGGLGLGLAIVKGLAELHGGSVRAESRGLGQGSIFIVTLPVAAEPPALTSQPTTPRSAARPLRVLVVEDNQDTAESLKMLLEAYGHEVAVAYSGLDGVQTAVVIRPDVVLCDIGLPGLDGYTVAATLRRNPATQSARLIALSGYGRDEDRQRAKEAGFDEHLTKPTDPAVLQSLLAAVR